MRDSILKRIHQLEQWAQGAGSAWYFLPLRICVYLVLIVALLLSNLVALALLPATLLARKKTRFEPAKHELPAEVIEATDESFSDFIQRYSTQVPVLVDFWAPWCGPCILMKPALKTLAERRKGELIVLTVNGSTQSQVSGEYRVAGLPTLVLIRNQREVARNVGALNLDALETFLEQAEELE